MTPVAGHTHLYRRGAVYYFYRRIPSDVLPLFREEFRTGFVKVSLRTKDRAEAVKKLHLEAVKWDAAFDLRKTQSEGGELSDFALERFARMWVAERLGEDEVRRDAGLTDKDYADIDETLDVVDAGLSYALAKGDTRIMDFEIEDWLATKGVSLVKGSPGHRTAMLRFLKAHREVIDKRKARHAGLVVETPKPALSVALPPQEEGLTVTELLDRYEREPKRAGIRERSKAGYAIIFRVLKELLGPDKRVRAITREDCRQLRDVLLKLPPNYTKRFPGMAAKEAAEHAAKEGIAPLAPGTVDGYLENLAAVFNWAVAEEYMERNPAKALGVGQKVKDKDKRLPFTLGQLQAIFSAPLYTGCRDDEANYAAPGPNHPRRARFWVPLLSLWTGMRLNECCQLLTSDVRTLDGVPCIFISEEAADGSREAGRGKPAPVKRVKTEAGERFVPIHPELIRIGFLEFVEKKRAARTERLFPELSPSAEGYFSDAFSKWFSRFLASRNAKTSRTSFHSFRQLSFVGVAARGDQVRRRWQGVGTSSAGGARAYAAPRGCIGPVEFETKVGLTQLSVHDAGGRP